MTAIKKLIESWSLKTDTEEVLRDFQAWANKYDLYVSGYLPATMQRNFSVMVKPCGKNIAKIKRGLKTLAPLLKPITNKHGLKDHFFISIFEHTLSEHGTYHMLVAKDLSEAVVIKSYYHQESVEFKGTLDATLKHIAEHHWYG